jgi:hypothetical protein
VVDDELTPEQRSMAEDAETMVPRALLLGRRPDDIVADLVRLDWSPEAARALVARVANDLRRFHESPESRLQLLAEAKRQWLGGILLLSAAVVIAAITLLSSLAGVFTLFVVPFGLALGGLVLAGRGCGRWRYYRRLSLPPDRLDRSE